MAKIQVDLTNKAEIALTKVEARLLAENKKTTKIERVNIALEWIGDVLEHLDEEDLRNILPKNKTL